MRAQPRYEQWTDINFSGRSAEDPTSHYEEWTLANRATT